MTAKLFTFHYASTLSQPVGRHPGRETPFTFHYASTLSGSHGRLLAFQGIFTFHYASTLSRMPCRYRRGRKEFTFHYASTLSPGCSIAVTGVSNLHSTMLLLYRRSGRTGCCIRFIYIPLCFYFISRFAGNSDAGDTFTFHYASTLSFNVYPISGDLAIFTFHYASTLSWTCLLYTSDAADD